MSIFAKIERKYNWKFEGTPIPLKGGYIHKMYKIETEQGTYALKLLNKYVMQRKTAMDNYAKAEQLELLYRTKGYSYSSRINLRRKKNAGNRR